MDECNEVREKDITFYLQAKANLFRGYTQGGSLVLRFGPAHEGLATKAAQLIDPRLPLQVYSKTDSTAESPVLDLARSRNKRLDDLIYAQAVVLTVFYNAVVKRMADEHNLAVFAQKYEGIFGLLTELARSLPLAEIKSLCANREDPVAFLESNQIGNQLFHYRDTTGE